MAKSDKATVKQRVHEVSALLLAGAETPDIRQHAAKWDVSPRQLYRYIEVAYKRFAKTLDRDFRQLFGRHVAQRRMLLARCLRIQDYKTALAVLNSEVELLRTYSDRELLKRVETLEARLATRANGVHRNGFAAQKN